jgi:peptide/nickel transport system substrate-binding protein
MEKRDDHTVIIHLKAPSVNVPADLAGYHMRILPSDRTIEQLVDEPSGTGPFKRASWSPGERVTYARNDKYWQPGLPYLDGFAMVTMPEENSRVAALAGGAVDLLWQLTAQALPAVQGQPGVNVLKAPSGNYQPIVMKSDMKPFDDVRVRQAFKAAVDRQTFVQAVTQGFGQPAADHPIAAFALPDIAKHVPIPKRDVDRAKRLLAEAGYPNGLDVTLWASEGRAGMVESAVTFQEMAKPAGIRVTIQKTPISTYWDEVWMKRELCTSNWTTVPTIDKALTQAYHSEAKWNESFFTSPELDRLIEQGRAEPDETKRAAIYVKAAQLLADQGGSIIPYFRDNITAARSRVKGFVMDPRTEYDFRSVWVEG